LVLARYGVGHRDATGMHTGMTGWSVVAWWWPPPYVVVVLVVVWAMVVYGPPSLVPLAPWPSLRMLPTAMA